MKLLKSQEKQKSLNLMFWLMDTLKQLLARSRYFYTKTNQNGPKPIRTSLLFDLYPDIQKSYHLTQDLRNIFEKLLIK
jgi:hypothetical protein